MYWIFFAVATLGLCEPGGPGGAGGGGGGFCQRPRHRPDSTDFKSLVDRSYTQPCCLETLAADTIIIVSSAVSPMTPLAMALVKVVPLMLNCAFLIQSLKPAPSPQCCPGVAVHPHLATHVPASGLLGTYMCIGMVTSHAGTFKHRPCPSHSSPATLPPNVHCCSSWLALHSSVAFSDRVHG
jgi:hypothetical protein